MAFSEFCHDCLTKPRLPASKRMYQSKNKPKWQTHVQGHIDGLDGRKPVTRNSQTPQCYRSLPFDPAAIFLSLRRVRNLHDNKTKVSKEIQNMKAKEDKLFIGRDDKSRAKERKTGMVLNYAFVTSTIESIKSSVPCSRNTRELPPEHSTPFHISTVSSCENSEGGT